MNLTKYEQETIVNYNAGEQIATVYTADKVVMRHFDSLIIEFPEVYHLLEQTEVSKTYSMPKSYISYHKPRRISEEQREKARNKMEKLNERKK